MRVWEENEMQRRSFVENYREQRTHDNQIIAKMFAVGFISIYRLICVEFLVRLCQFLP